MSLFSHRFFSELLPLASYCLIMSGTPGPNNIMLASSGANFGYRRVLPTILGIQIGIFAQTILVCVGLGSLFTSFPLIQQVLKIAGSVYLIYLAWQLSGASINDVESLKPVSFSQAAIFQALNPKSWVKAITLASVFMPPELNPWTGAILIAVIGCILGTPCSIVWTLFGVSIRHLLRNPQLHRLFNWTMAAALFVLAILFLR